jgi:hypothetical protein
VLPGGWGQEGTASSGLERRRRHGPVLEPIGSNGGRLGFGGTRGFGILLRLGGAGGGGGPSRSRLGFILQSISNHAVANPNSRP